MGRSEEVGEYCEATLCSLCKSNVHPIAVLQPVPLKFVVLCVGHCPTVAACSPSPVSHIVLYSARIVAVATALFGQQFPLLSGPRWVPS